MGSLNQQLSVLAVALILGASSSLECRPSKDAGPVNLEQSDSQKSLGDEELNVLYLRARTAALEGNHEIAASAYESILSSDPTNTFLKAQLAEIYLGLGNADRAEALGKEALQADPKNIAYLTLLANVYSAGRKYLSAKEMFEAVLKQTPNDLRVMLLLGIVEAESGQLPQAIQRFTQAEKAHPDSHMPLFYRAKIHLESQDLPRAEADLKKAIALNPDFSEAGLALAMIYEQQGATTKAIESYRAIPGSGRFKKRLAQLYLQINELGSALEAFMEYEAFEPEDYTAKVKIALIYFELKDYSNAEKRLVEILKKEPGADNVKFYLGAVYEESKQDKKALATLSEITQESSFYKEATLHIGYIFKRQKRYKEGLQFAKKAAEKSPDIPEFFDMNASFHEELNQIPQALTVLTTGIGRNPKDERLLYYKGVLHDKVGEKELAILSMKKLIELSPENAHALNFLGYTYAEMGTHLEDAEVLVQKALTLRPGDGYVIDSLAWVYFKQGKYDKAVENLERAMLLLPDEPIIMEHAGDIYSKMNNFEKAESSYKKAVELSQSKDKNQASKIQKKLAAVPKEKRQPTND